MFMSSLFDFYKLSEEILNTKSAGDREEQGGGRETFYLIWFLDCDKF